MMKIKVTLIAENDIPANYYYGKNPHAKARAMWEKIAELLTEIGGAKNDTVTLDSVEILEEDKDAGLL